jgi:hypothetical protein
LADVTVAKYAFRTLGSLLVPTRSMAQMNHKRFWIVFPEGAAGKGNVECTQIRRGK